MITENLPAKTTSSTLVLLAQRVEANRADLIQRCAQVLRASLFTNRIELHPRDLAQIATHEADALISALRDSFATARQHGVELCQAGLGSQAVFGIIQAESDFLMAIGENGSANLNIAIMYPLKLVDGFMAEREKVILREQENIRRAFQIALKHVSTEVQEAQVIAQKATEISSRKIIMAQEEERRRISRELHDEAGQVMLGIRMSLENLKIYLSGNPELKMDIEKAIFFTDSAVQKISSLAYNLRPPVLDLLGLNLAIKQLCINFYEQTGLIISYSGTEPPTLSDELAISLYRIIQEALTNIVKHARAKHAWVKFKYTPELITLSIKDDGQGFNPETTHPGIGLESMRERSHLLNGKMQIESSNRRPTLLKFSFPIILKTV